MKLYDQDSGGFTAGTADNALLWTSSLLSRYKEFVLETDNPADVEVSINNGVSFLSTAVALEDVHVAAAVGTRVLVTAANKCYRIAPGLRFTHLRLRQAGTSNVTAFKLLCVTKDE